MRKREKTQQHQQRINQQHHVIRHYPFEKKRKKKLSPESFRDLRGFSSTSDFFLLTKLLGRERERRDLYVVAGSSSTSSSSLRRKREEPRKTNNFFFINWTLFVQEEFEPSGKGDADECVLVWYLLCDDVLLLLLLRSIDSSSLRWIFNLVLRLVLFSVPAPPQPTNQNKPRVSRRCRQKREREEKKRRKQDKEGGELLFQSVNFIHSSSSMWKRQKNESI